MVWMELLKTRTTIFPIILHSTESLIDDIKEIKNKDWNISFHHTQPEGNFLYKYSYQIEM